jgi:hypothetical protein
MKGVHLKLAPHQPATFGPALAATKAGMLQETFSLEEGSVTVTFPENMSSSSYEDLQDYFDLFLRKGKAQADLRGIFEPIL